MTVATSRQYSSRSETTVLSRCTRTLLTRKLSWHQTTLLTCYKFGTSKELWCTREPLIWLKIKVLTTVSSQSTVGISIKVTSSILLMKKWTYQNTFLWWNYPVLLWLLNNNWRSWGSKSLHRCKRIKVTPCSVSLNKSTSSLLLR